MCDTCYVCFLGTREGSPAVVSALQGRATSGGIHEGVVRTPHVEGEELPVLDPTRQRHAQPLTQCHVM